MYHVENHKKHDDYYMKISLEKQSLLRVRVHVSPSSWKHLLQGMFTHASTDNEKNIDLFEAISTSNTEGYTKASNALAKTMKPVNGEFNQI